MNERPTDEQLLNALFVLTGEAGDLSLCPYYQGTGTCMQKGRCTYEMGNPEPMCQTCIPTDGWPLDHHAEVRAWMLTVTQTAAQEEPF
jgi:hypothetical protein